VRQIPWVGLVLVLAACDHAATDAEPYRIVVDGGAYVRAFGEDTFTADEAAETLVALGPAAVPALAEALVREPADVRAKAIEVLAAIGSADAVPALLAAARQDESPDVRGDALRALGTIGDARGTPVVEDALDDSQLAIRAGGVMACKSLCTGSKAIERLADIALGDPDVSVALAARTSLAALHARDAERAALVRAAVARGTPGSTADARALFALLVSDVQPDDGSAALVDALAAASPPLQRQIAWRLGFVGDEHAARALAALLASADERTRGYAHDALARLGDRGVGAATDALARHAGPPPAGPLAPPDM